jgi:hypothetical protein
MTNEFTSSAGRFNSHRGATEQYRQHHPCGMSKATPEATGCRHRATTCSILPQRPPGQQSTKQKSNNSPTLLAVLMAIAMRQYNTARMAQWRRSRASLEVNKGCHHWASTCSNSHQSDIPTLVFSNVFCPQIIEKDHKAQGSPRITIEVWHIKLMKSTELVWQNTLLGGG